MSQSTILQSSWDIFLVWLNQQLNSIKLLNQPSAVSEMIKVSSHAPCGHVFDRSMISNFVDGNHVNILVKLFSILTIARVEDCLFV